MVERLIKVIYWTCNAVACLLVFGGVSALITGASINPALTLISVGAIAFLIWLFGRAIRFIALGN